MSDNLETRHFDDSISKIMDELRSIHRELDEVKKNQIEKSHYEKDVEKIHESLKQLSKLDPKGGWHL